MERFSFSGLWLHVGSTFIGAMLPVADALVSYFANVQLPTWAHVLVGLASAALLFYKGKIVPKPA